MYQISIWESKKQGHPSLCKIINQSLNIKIIIIPIIIIPIIWPQIPGTWNRNPQYLFLIPIWNSDNNLSFSCNINSSSFSYKPTSSISNPFTSPALAGWMDRLFCLSARTWSWCWKWFPRSSICVWEKGQRIPTRKS